MNSVVDSIFNTIITTLTNFVLWEILMFINSIQISKKKFQLRLVILFFSSLSFLLFNVTKSFVLMSETTCGPSFDAEDISTV